MAAINDADFRPAPKPQVHRNRRLLDMAMDQTCLLAVPGTCNGDQKTTVACHSNLSEHGKAGKRKADDQWHVWGCSDCHWWLDFGPAPAEEKRERFMAAHAWMVSIWQDIDAGLQSATPAERAAVRWALERVGG